MSIRLEMLQVARLAPEVLGEAAELVLEFFKARQNPDGGFRGRSAESDLYYTVFGIEGITAMQGILDIDRLKGYLQTFGLGEHLDFVHLCCLARCWANVAQASEQAIPEVLVHSMSKALERYRTEEGGFAPTPSSSQATAYAAFTGVAALQDLGLPISNREGLINSLENLKTGDGVWANELGVPVGSTNATAAAVIVMRQLEMPVEARVGEWLLRQVDLQGGFKAASLAPIPDLLSTATALHTLASIPYSFDSVADKCLDFVDSLWVNEGAFYGHWHEDLLDVEYTSYGLLALGHLSVVA